jgi:predicted Co/Zn/Cd cation transporter (cation efflux family)
VSAGTVVAACSAIALTLASGLADSYGFVHASRLWHGGRIVPIELARSGLGFVIGIATYWILLRFAEQLGVHSVAIQTIGWFGATLIGVAVLTGEFRSWGLANQIVAVGVAAGIGWLMVATGTE